MTVVPGDIVHGDEHGVINIPEEALPAIFDKAEAHPCRRATGRRLVAFRTTSASSDSFALKRVRH